MLIRNQQIPTGPKMFLQVTPFRATARAVAGTPGGDGDTGCDADFLEEDKLRKVMRNPHNWLVVTGTFYMFPYSGNFIIPNDELILIFFNRVGQPPTR